jgi:site-specific DNA-cytosine methylase
MKLILPPGLHAPPELWPDCELLEQPRPEPKPKKGSKIGVLLPRLLVRRREGRLFGSGGEDLVYLPGPASISLFTGCGGMDIGVEAAGFCTVAQHEWSEGACATLIANRPDYFGHSALIQGDIRATPTEMILDAAGLRVGECHLLTGGPPCQGFSWSNSNRGKAHDPRNDLVFEFLRVVRQAMPKYFCMENVPGFVELNKGAYFKAYLKAAYDCYYELVYGLCDAVEYGVPQYRCRFFCMGTRRDLAQIDGDLAGLPEAQTYDKLDLDIMDSLRGPLFEQELKLFKHAPGVRYFPDRPVLIPPPPIARKPGADQPKHRNSTYVEFYRKLERDEPDRIVRSPKFGGRNTA